MTIVQAVILGLVEGFTEFLPISSTGHLVLAAWLLNIPQTEFVKTFEIFIQLGAVLAVLTLYWHRLTQPKFMLAAFVPTAIVGLILYDPIKTVLLGNVWVTALSLLFGGIVLILIDRITFPRRSQTIASSIVIGCIQAISAIPGVSRAAAAIVGGQLTGLTRTQATEFSFLLALPTIAAATSLDLLKSDLQLSTMNYVLLATGFVVSYLTALVAIKSFVNYVSTHSLALFGWYRVVISLIVILWLLV